jgi:ankyrin repeat protein
MEAVKSGDSAAVKLLLDRGAEVNIKTGEGRTALMEAASRGHTATVQKLLDKDADIKAKDNSGNTALMNAVVSGNLQTVKILLNAGLDVNAESEYGWTPLVFASAFGHPEIVQAILDEGGDISEYGGMAMDWAAFWGGSRLDKAKIKSLLRKAATNKSPATPVVLTRKYKQMRLDRFVYRIQR